MRVNPATSTTTHVSSETRTDFLQSRPGTFNAEFWGIGAGSNEHLWVKGTDVISDVAAFLQNRWSIPSEHTVVRFVYHGKTTHTEGDPNEPSQLWTIQEMLDAANWAKGERFRVQFAKPAVIGQSTNSSKSKSYVDPSGTPVHAQTRSAATALAPQGAKGVPIVDFKTPHAERPLETVFRSSHGQVTALYVGGAEKLRDLVDVLKAEWGMPGNVQADITLNGARVMSDVVQFRQRVQDTQAQHRPLDVFFADNTAGLYCLVSTVSASIGTVVLGLAATL